MTPGPVLFARYAYPPNALGYCGPADHGALLDYAAAGVSDPGLVQLARGFEGAWPYLEVIAAASHITDPLDPRVVEAYWVGNSLLHAVDMRSFGDFLDERFRGRAGRGWDAIAGAIPAGAVPHHSFHVFAVYPWAGLLRAGLVPHPLHVLDRCRIRWGRVVTTSAGTVTVRYRPLAWDGQALTLGPPALESVPLSLGGKGFVRDLRPGEWVSLHWDWVCDRLSPPRLRSLQEVTLRQLRMASETPAPVLG
ncbi:MAG TPA: DUF6390 family protein [Streptosporangiaceae bacterium]|nr:DUF6390 family protein [Streptosporangiaceae bacterium]